MHPTDGCQSVAAPTGRRDTLDGAEGHRGDHGQSARAGPDPGEAERGHGSVVRAEVGSIECISIRDRAEDVNL